MSEVRPLPDPCPPSAGPGRHHRHLGLDEGPTEEGWHREGFYRFVLLSRLALG